ncbi:DUF4229 domain-containing protein [Marinitenerispora sediminis]|uniref:DUF4229 domain-containing protein n=1 Tax=Marinitenerispora sediminis TaxID=1931232 RepID=A0A368T175_9ACTN|nr:DUF4229 domain-containing protein [Marinitenerispora sediminis]RCV49972.1 DUF4229 domain-containing protein [Marinitenerispora sediminis]RCV50218.1 DUF4229 domain-containing protein [Marinitenerispora sediminis]RCV53432.1 DUF4229 domain-containing protein [Marinitenerispora sediminis]
MRSVIAYTASRLLLFAVAFGVLYLLGARGFLAIALAFLVSGMISYVLLSRQRDAMSAAVAAGLARMRAVGSRIDEASGKEDHLQEASDEPRTAEDGGAAEARPGGGPGRADRS